MIKTMLFILATSLFCSFSTHALEMDLRSEDRLNDNYQHCLDSNRCVEISFSEFEELQQRNNNRGSITQSRSRGNCYWVTRRGWTTRTTTNRHGRTRQRSFYGTWQEQVCRSTSRSGGKRRSRRRRH